MAALRDVDLELHRALEVDNSRAVRKLLSRKADPNASSAKGQAPLKIAVQKEDLFLCKMLLTYQADPEGVASQKSPTASEAATLVRQWRQCDLAAVFGCLEDCVIEAASSHDVTLLGLALASIDITGGDAEQVADLLDEKRNSLLHLCARGIGRSTDPTAEADTRLTARALVGWGVPVDGRNQNGETALYLALLGMHAAVRGREAGSPMLVPAEPARALLEARADAEELDPHTGEPLLMEASKAGDLLACRLLLEHNADPLRRNFQGQTAIDVCQRHEVAQFLRSTLPHGGILQRSLGEALPQDGPFRGDSFLTPIVRDASIVSPEPEYVNIEDQEGCSADGLLNQVDLEESYDQDWMNPEILNLEKYFERDWDAPVTA